MKIEKGNFCPFVQGECKKLECNFFVKLRGQNPNTGEPVDEWDCAISWIPVLLIENSQMQRQTGAAVESFRNEMVKSNESSQQVLLATIHQNGRLLSG